MDLIIRGGQVATTSGVTRVDVGIEDGRIAQLGGPMQAPEEIDAVGLYVLPGGVDAHVHLTPPRTGTAEPSWVDDFASGTRAALAGGVTTVGNMSFPRRGETMGVGLERDLADAAANSLADYFMHPVLLDPDPEGIAEIPALVAAGHPSVKVFLSFRRFDRRVDDFVAAFRAISESGAVGLLHCEDAAIMGCCGQMLEEGGRTDHRFYPESRPIEAERIATERAVGFCEITGMPTYVVHLSSEAALEACRRARARGLPLYVETRPIYLYLERSLFDEPDGAKYAGAPPLREQRDRAAIWAGIADGSVATVCTDHAPWNLAEKTDPAIKAQDLRQGMAELETLLPMLWSMGVATGKISVPRFVEMTSSNAARIFGLYPRKGCISPGSDADLVVFDPNETRTINGADMHSNADYSPYDGWEITGWPRLTIQRGTVVARGTEVLAEPGNGTLVPRTPFERP